MRLPQSVGYHRADVKQPFCPDFAHSSIDPGIELVTGSSAMNAEVFNYKRLLCIRSWQFLFQHG
jgi:hypothetical protein